MYLIEHATPKQKYLAIHGMVCRVPIGHVATYGQIADMVGLPGRARLVGKALGAAFVSARVPWWRVIRADGRIAFGADTASGQRQSSLLLQEGVVVVQMRVALRDYQWRPHLDDALFHKD